ncbi:helicase-associated domain-containing protein [Crossiella sp. NPDC003009]
MSGPSLAAWLRAQDETRLAALLRARPDLATPSPGDTSVLATRAGIRASIARACEDLDSFTLTVLEALLLAGADTAPRPLTEVSALLGKGVPVKATKAAVELLRSRALAWGPDTALSVPPAATEAVTLFPAGLGRPDPRLDGADLPALLAGLDETERKLLETLADGQPTGRTRDAGTVVPLEKARNPVQKLLARGLLLRRDAETVELPRQVGLALRGNRAFRAVEVTEPALDTGAHNQATVDATAAGAAMELLRQVEGLIGFWSEEPPPVLRSGGLGVRELRRLAKEIDVDERRAGLLAELVVGAGLAGDSEAGEPEWVPTTLADTWLVGTPEQRWATLAQAWLDLPRLPGLYGRRDEKDRPLGVLSEELRRPLAPRERRRVLDVLADLPPGATVKDVRQLAAVLAWRAPRRGGRLRDDLVEWTVAEGTVLGVLALDALSGPGRTLLTEGPTAAAKTMADAMPAPVDHVLVQADLTVVAPGPLEADLAADIALVADVESAGGATVYRVTEATARRALDSGRTAADLHELFRTRSRTPVPQSLTYLIDDVARRHGRLRGGAAGSFLRCDDPVLVAEVLASAEADRLALRRIAPTVLVSPMSLAEVLDGLRAAGFAPAAEGPDGQVLDLRPAGRRITARIRHNRRPVLPGGPSEEQLLAVVAQMKAGDAAAATPRGATISPTDSATTLALLRGAAEAGRSVWLGFVDNHGVASQRVVNPVSVAGGMLEGFDQAHGTLRRFPVHRITSVAVVEDA